MQQLSTPPAVGISITRFVMETLRPSGMPLASASSTLDRSSYVAGSHLGVAEQQPTDVKRQCYLEE